LLNNVNISGPTMVFRVLESPVFID
jgi:hypothetical protein